VLALISFCYLVVYNHRLALAIQTNNVLARIVENLHSAISERSQLYQARGQPKDDADANRQRCLAQGHALFCSVRKHRREGRGVLLCPA
jgi:hypothetical protein